MNKDTPEPPASLASRIVGWSLFGSIVAGSFYAAGIRRISDPEPPFVARFDDGDLKKPFKRIQYRMLRMYKNNVDPPEFLVPFLRQGQQMHSKMPTLLIEPEGVLFHTKWSPEKGWHVVKRPYAEYFLAYMSRSYEIVIWASQCHNQGGESQIEKSLDKLNLMSGGAIPANDPAAPHMATRLFRDHLTFDLDGTYSLRLVKDLELLGRDLKNLVVLESEKEGVIHGDNNLILTPDWDEKDTYLLDMLPFLETLAQSRAGDLRTIVKQYQGLDIPQTFARNVEKVKKQQKPQQQSSLLSFFGVKKPAIQQQSEQDALRQHHNQFAKIMENVKTAQAEQYKEAEAAQKEFLQKAGSNLKITLWDMMIKGADVAIREGLDVEGREYLDKIAAAQ